MLDLLDTYGVESYRTGTRRATGYPQIGGGSGSKCASTSPQQSATIVTCCFGRKVSGRIQDRHSREKAKECASCSRKLGVEPAMDLLDDARKNTAIRPEAIRGSKRRMYSRCSPPLCGGLTQGGTATRWIRNFLGFCGNEAHHLRPSRSGWSKNAASACGIELSCVSHVARTFSDFCALVTGVRDYGVLGHGSCHGRHARDP
jgi:hypothetical protein